jgi:hypothetical protein
MTKHTNESFDAILDEFNKLNDTDFVRIEDYRGIHEDIKLYNQTTNTYHYTSLMSLKDVLRTNKSILSLKQCSHTGCSYNVCVHQYAAEHIDKLIDIYVNSDNMQKEVAEYLNISVSQATHIIKDLKINETYKSLRDDRIYHESACYNPFSSLENMKADEHWLLGYLLADGSIGTRKRKSLSICSIDKELLEHCCKIFRLDFDNITETKSNRNIKSGEYHTYYGLNIIDNNICDSLISLGVIPNKTYKDTHIRINPEYKFDFLRGLFDGDGCASKGGFSVVGNPSYMKQIHEELFQSLALKETRSKYMLSLEAKSIPQTLWLYNKMYYSDDILCLTRKRLKIYEKIKHLKLDKVKDITFTDEDIPVCDLNIWGSHTFFANDIYVHNCDFNAEELRIPTLITKEPIWTDAFANDKDVHKMTAISIWGEENYNKDKRKIAKSANFGILYGQTGRNFAEKFDMTIEEGNQFVEDFKAALPTLFRWVSIWEKVAEKQGYVTTLFGRPVRLRSYFQSGERGWIAYAKRLAINGTIQGTGADIMKYLLIRLFQTFYLTGRTNELRFINMIHDEVNYQMRKDLLYKLVAEVFAIQQVQLPDWAFPMKTGLDIGNRWGQSVGFEYDYNHDTGELKRIYPKADPMTVKNICASFGIKDVQEEEKETIEDAPVSFNWEE